MRKFFDDLHDKLADIMLDVEFAAEDFAERHPRIIDYLFYLAGAVTGCLLLNWFR